MPSNDRYLVQLRRELTRSQARLAKAEQERDRLAKENLELRERLKRIMPTRTSATAKRER